MAAALLHEFGNLIGLMEPDKYEILGDCGIINQENVGGDFLFGLSFPEMTVKLVRNQVNANRYWAFKYPDKLALLSET